MKYYMPELELVVKSRFFVSESSLRSSEDTAIDPKIRALFKGSDKEKFIVLHLNIKNKIKSYEVASIGSMNSSIVHPREIYRTAIVAGATSVIFIHNHPSQDPEPSVDDIEITNRLCKSGAILGINVLDHIIITDDEDKYYSFKKQNMM